MMLEEVLFIIKNNLKNFIHNRKLFKQNKYKYFVSTKTKLAEKN